MANISDDRDSPLSTADRLFCEPLWASVIHCAFTLQSSIDVAQFKAQLRTSPMLQHPRFCSLLLRDSRGCHRWRRTSVDIDRHVFVHCQPLSEDPSVSEEDAVNDFMANIWVSSPLPEDKPLWEIHLLLAHNTVVYRVDHALGDGISLMSMFSGCQNADDPSQNCRESTSAPQRSVWSLVMGAWYCLIYSLELLRMSWVKNRTTAFSGGAGVELWPRKLASARFQLDDMKLLKGVVTGATINDVLVGIISCGLSRYLDLTSSPKGPEGLSIFGFNLINMRREKGLIQNLSQVMDTTSGTHWGNIFSIIILPINYHRGDSDPIQFVKRAKAIMDQKKQSMVALISYKFLHFFTILFGGKLASILTYRLSCNTTFSLSNIVGPKEKIAFGGNHVKSLRVSTTSLPHAIQMHMVSYAGTAYLQILVAKDVIPNPKVLARCFEDALRDMKQAALAAKPEPA